jgi:hypothetical protein
MSEAQAVTGLASAVSLLGIVMLLMWLYRDYRVDAFRQQMFAMRDELFDLANAGLISFDDSAYGMLRRTMNGYIRFGHRLSLLHVLIFAVITRSSSRERSFDSRWVATLATLPPEARERLQEFRHGMDRLVVKHAILNSPLLVAMVVPALLGAFLAEMCARWLSRQLRTELDKIDTAALAYGEA